MKLFFFTELEIAVDNVSESFKSEYSNVLKPQLATLIYHHGFLICYLFK